MEPVSRVVAEWSSDSGRVAVVEGTRGFEARRETCPHAQFWVLLGGRWTERRGGRSRAIERAQTVAYAPKEPCFRIAEEDYLGVSIQLYGAAYDSLPRELPREAHQAVWRLAHMARNGQLSEAELGGLAKLGEHTSRKLPDWLEHAYARLSEGDYHDLETLAHEVGISPNHLSAEFTNHYGISIAHFVRRQRVRLAIGQGHADWILGGFYDPSHFHRVCKQEFGLPVCAITKLLSA